VAALTTEAGLAGSAQQARPVSRSRGVMPPRGPTGTPPSRTDQTRLRPTSLPRSAARATPPLGHGSMGPVSSP
jgi:hypothetical protein